MFNAGMIGLVCVITTIASYISTILVTRYAQKNQITDDPNSNPLRKRQKEPIPLLGATGFVVVSLFVSVTVWLLRDTTWFNLGSFIDLNDGNIRLGWVLASVLVLLIGGYFDDKFNLSAKWMFFPISLALLIAVFGGNLQISALSYPFDNLLPSWEILPQVLAFLWLGFCLAATKFLDGHDGLVSTVGIVALLSIASVSLFSNVFQPLVFAFSVIWAAGLIGFLPFNFPNAKVYLGEGGSEIIGFIIGVLSIISGAKIATAATVIGWFILDIILVLLWRFFASRPLFEGDRLHWHFRLVDLGLNKLQVLVLTTIMLMITANLGLYVPTEQKATVLIAQSVVLFSIFMITLALSIIKAKKVPVVSVEPIEDFQIIASKDEVVDYNTLSMQDVEPVGSAGVVVAGSIVGEAEKKSIPAPKPVADKKSELKKEIVKKAKSKNPKKKKSSRKRKKKR